MEKVNNKNLQDIRGRGKCNNFETVLDFAPSALKLVVLDSHKTYCI